jgi:hypothetical protein
MTKLSFKQSDVTGDTRILARSALGYDWNYLADDETLIFGTDSDATITWDGSALNVTGTTTEITDGDLQVLAENLYLGAATAFATTEPTSAVIFKTGTQAAGAIVTSSALMANDTVLRKIIADGTVSSVG